MLTRRSAIAFEDEETVHYGNATANDPTLHTGFE